MTIEVLGSLPADFEHHAPAIWAVTQDGRTFFETPAPMPFEAAFAWASGHAADATPADPAQRCGTMAETGIVSLYHESFDRLGAVVTRPMRGRPYFSTFPIQHRIFFRWRQERRAEQYIADRRANATDEPDVPDRERRLARLVTLHAALLDGGLTGDRTEALLRFALDNFPIPKDTEDAADAQAAYDAGLNLTPNAEELATRWRPSSTLAWALGQAWRLPIGDRESMREVLHHPMSAVNLSRRLVLRPAQDINRPR